jgi:hypothetical protein
MVCTSGSYLSGNRSEPKKASRKHARMKGPKQRKRKNNQVDVHKLARVERTVPRQPCKKASAPSPAPVAFRSQGSAPHVKVFLNSKVSRDTADNRGPPFLFNPVICRLPLTRYRAQFAQSPSRYPQVKE